MDERRRGSVARVHAGLGLAVVVCSFGFAFETWRALSGNLLSWAYVVEWPVLLIVAVHYWRHLLADARGLPRRRAAAAAEAAGADDPALAAWNSYVAGLDATGPAEAVEP